MCPRKSSIKAEETGIRRYVLIVLISILVLSLPAAHNALGQGGGAANDTPSFDHISIVQNNGLVYVNMVVKDLNGWEDIYRITLTVTNSTGAVISEVEYSQYSNLIFNSTSIEWHELTGSYLNRELSDWEPQEISPWNPDGAATPVGLNVTFVLNDISGHYVHVKVTDRPIYDGQDGFCEYTGPFLQQETDHIKVNPTVYGLLISAVTFLSVLLIIAIVLLVRKK